MREDISKTVIRIIQNYCFNNSALVLNHEFVLTVSPLITKSLQMGTLNLGELRKIVLKRKDFFYANDIDINNFCKGLFKKLNYELSFYDDISFHESMIEFKRKMENGNHRGFPKDNTTEDTLRSVLVLYITRETFCEPRSGAGNSDIIVPSERIIIETKLWRGPEYYNSGFPELNDYLIKSNYSEGYYIIFDYNKNPNTVIQTYGEVFDKQYMGKSVHVIFVRMNAISPSQIYKTNKKKQQVDHPI